jgi:hypothetical protein
MMTIIMAPETQSSICAWCMACPFGSFVGRRCTAVTSRPMTAATTSRSGSFSERCHTRSVRSEVPRPGSAGSHASKTMRARQKSDPPTTSPAAGQDHAGAKVTGSGPFDGREGASASRRSADASIGREVW